MFSFFKKKPPKEIQDNINLIKSLQRRPLSHVTKRDENGERIITKDAYFSIVANDLIIMKDNNIIFRENIDNIKAGELMSLNGITLIVEKENSKDTYVAYYLYHR